MSFRRIDMKIIYSFIFFLVLFNAVHLYSQTPDEIELKAEAIILSMADDNIFPENDFLELKTLLFSNTEGEFWDTNSNPESAAINELIKHFLNIETNKIDASTDSALILFVDWYLHLQRIFYYPNREIFFSSTNPKIIFFSTSVSCHCTLEMCKKQLIDVLKLKRERSSEYTFLIVDAFGNNELQKEYKALFVPSVVVLDDENRLQLKIEYKENMIDSLMQYLNNI